MRQRSAERAAVTTPGRGARQAGQPADGEDHLDSYELVVVSYRSRAQLEQMLQTVPADRPLVVVDNARGVDRVDEVLVGRPHARYLDSGGDAGFAKAANLAAQTSTCAHLVFASPDSRPDVDVCAALVAQLRADPTIGSCSAGTVDADGRMDFAGGWEPTLWRTLVQAFGAHHLLPRAGLWYRPRPGEVTELEWLGGESLTVRRHEFLALGGWDDRYFLYGEDMGLGRRVREAGLRQLLRGDLLVTHLAGGSGAAATFMLRHRGASMVEYLRDHNGTVLARAMQAVITVGTLGRLAKAALARRSNLVLEYRAYLRGLWFGRGPLS